MDGFVHPEFLVETDWLAQHLGDAVVLDCTTHLISDPKITYVVKPGREDFERGHIPGAQFCDVSRDVSDTTQTLNFMQPTPETFATAMCRFGISNGTRVVTYSTGSPWWATR
ncbi:MAG: thiosulfate/3-mercaptopyruvate sulfurtransferase, partial [Acetobacteraceae bacterium]|nr:thiosulfate/3-mercaptopyruvate sulfurtransferase [Acetobacteraceae bacterium]